jgi:hypothetical protein
MLVTLRTGDWSATSVSLAGRDYQKLLLPDAQPLARPGAPDIPVYRRIVALPDCDSVSVEVYVDSVSVMSGVRVVPYPNDPAAGGPAIREDETGKSGGLATLTLHYLPLENVRTGRPAP